MADIVQPMRFEIDVKNGLITKPQRTILMKGDKNANRIIVALTEDGKPFDLTGATVTGRFIRPPDGAEVPLTGEAVGNEARVTLIDQCYTADGFYEASIILTLGDVRRTVLSISGTVHSAGSGAYVDVSGVIPSVDDIIAQYAEMQRVTQETQTARDEAKAETERVAAVREDAEQAVQDAQKAILLTENWGNVTVTVSMLAADAAPVVTLTDTGTGKTMAFSLPRGLTGLTPNLTIGTVETLEEGAQASATITGTAENPKLNLSIPRGFTGAIEHLTINGKPVEGSTITLTAEDVGALPAGGTAANAEKLGGKAPEYYIQPRNLLDNSDFRNPVNQRGVVTSGAFEYFIDRWITGSAGCTLSADGVNIVSNCWFFQRIAKETFDTYLSNGFTFCCETANGDILTLNTVADNGSGIINGVSLYVANDYLESAGYYDFRIITDTSTTCTVKWAALYEGAYTADTLPPYVPKGYAAELAECQRYYIKIAHSSSVFDTCQLGFITDSAKKLVISVPIENMRITPTASLAGKIIIRGISGYVDSSSNGIDLAVERCTQRSIVFIRPDGNAFSLNATNNTPIQISLASDASIGFSADL